MDAPWPSFALTVHAWDLDDVSSVPSEVASLGISDLQPNLGRFPGWPPTMSEDDPLNLEISDSFLRSQVGHQIDLC